VYLELVVVTGEVPNEEATEVNELLAELTAGEEADEIA